MKHKKLVADLFCGAGGTSTGARKALAARGMEMELVAVNHWPVAIETHSRNHPDARHYVEDLDTAKPLDIVPEGKLDLLMASPSCVHHSRARGGRPTSEQQRTDPWIIIKWLTDLRVKRLLVENVPEFMTWGPISLTTNRPLKSAKGKFFQAWVAAIRALGYTVDYRVLCAADYGDATTRKRFFLQARSDGKKITWPEPTHSKNPGVDMFGNVTLPWRTAREIIDWSIEGKSIFDRKKPLAENTLRRIEAGIRKFGGIWTDAFLVMLNGGNYKGEGGALSLDNPVPTIVATPGHVALCQVSNEEVPESFLTSYYGNSQSAQSTAEPLDTVSTRDRFGLVEPAVQPFVLGQQSGAAPRSTEEPLPTITTDGAISVIDPFVTMFYGDKHGKSRVPNALDKPLNTITTGPRFALTQGVLIEQELPIAEMVVPIDQTSSPSGTRSADEPLGTIVTKSNRALVEASAFLIPQFTEAPNQPPRTHSLDDPMPTVTSHGAGALVYPVVGKGMVVEYNGKHYLLDIRFRMLKPHELARAMGFSDEETSYEFVGNQEDIVKQIGNAVPVNTAMALVSAMMER